MSTPVEDHQAVSARPEVAPTTWTATWRAVKDRFEEDSPVETISSWPGAAGTAAESQMS